ncbi:HK97 family phage prohead protease [Paenibacillus macerans]|uniref:HK97 family phage prohead protease n=1 Tax=Paenibacillus macerans TaxID=44252 RepID=UPI003D321421
MELEKKTPKMTEPEKRILATKIEVRAAEEGGAGKRTIVGSIKYDSESQVMQDWYGDKFVEVISPGAFSEYLRENPTLSLWCHRTDQILGNTKPGTLRLFDSETELRFELDLPNSSWGNDAYESIDRGDVDGVSFGFNVLPGGDKWSKIEANGETIYKRTVMKATLPEISPTPFAAYPANEVNVRSLEEFKSQEQRAESEYRKRKLLLELDLM